MYHGPWSTLIHYQPERRTGHSINVTDVSKIDKKMYARFHHSDYLSDMGFVLVKYVDGDVQKLPAWTGFNSRAIDG